jgi:hypothetical protein
LRYESSSQLLQKEKPLAVGVTGLIATAVPRLVYLCLLLEVLYILLLMVLTNDEIVWAVPPLDN